MRLVDSEGFLCGICLDLTLYLPDAPTASEGRTALEIFRSLCPPEQLQMVCSPNEEWEELGRPPTDDDLAPYLARMDERIDEGIWVWDGVEDGWSFLIRGVPPQEEEESEDDSDDDEASAEDVSEDERYSEDEPDQPERLVEVASLCQLQLPESASPDDLLVIARRLVDLLPFVSGHGGFAFTYDPWRKDQAFDQIYAWAKRFLGVDVHDLNRTLPLALDKAKAVNWLTLLGTGLWNTLKDTRGGNAPRFGPGIIVESGRYGVLIRAGDRPQTGDRNRREFPQLYAEVNQEIAPLLMRRHPEFAGRFAENNATEAWFSRFSEPAGW